MQFNFIWDASVSSAPAAFKAAVIAAGQTLASYIDNSITLNIRIGWGENNGSSIGSALATGGVTNGTGDSFAQLRSALGATETTGEDASTVTWLQQPDPTGGGNFYIGGAQRKLFGTLSATSTAVDGTVGFSSTAAFDYNPADGIAAGQFDFNAVALHEITHAMGRETGLQYVPGWYFPLDLFRFSAPGALQLVQGQPAYFSVDGGKTNLSNFDTVSDPGDWAQSVLNDPFGAFASQGTVEALSSTDLRVMDVLGYHLSAAGQALAHLGNAVVDVAANISANLDGYGANPPTSITISNNNPLTIAVSQITSDAAALAVTVNANSSAYTLDIADTAASVAAGLATLNGDGHVASIAFTDSGTPTLSVTFSQYSTDTTALGKIIGTRDLVVTGVTGQAYSSFEHDYAGGILTGSKYFYTDISGQAYTSAVSAYDGNGFLSSTRFNGVTSQAYSSYEYDYGYGLYVVVGSKYFFTNVTGQAYTSYEEDLDLKSRLTKLAFAGAAGQAYSSFEYDYDGGVFAGSKYFFTDVTGQAYTGYEQDLDVNGRLTRLAFTDVSGQAYSSFEYDYAGGVLTGSKYVFTGVTGQAYTGYEQDLDSSGRLTRFAYTGVSGQAFSSYERDYTGGIQTGSKYFFTGITNQAYTGYEQDIYAGGSRTLFTGVFGPYFSSYEYDYVAGVLTGFKDFYTNIAGQPYTGSEQDYDTSGKLAKFAVTGVSGQSYSSYEYDYNAGVLTGSRYFTTNVANQPYTGYEQDLDTQGHLTKLAFSGVVGQPYTAYEYDYANGALVGSKYFYTNVPNQAYSSYETDLDAGGAATLQILDNNDGSHRIIGFQDNLTFHSEFNDVTTGGGGNETFVYSAYFGQSTVTDFASHTSGAGHDSFQMPTSDFADFASLLAGTRTVGGNAVITAANGDQLTLAGVTKTTLTTLGADFSFG